MREIEPLNLELLNFELPKIFFGFFVKRRRRCRSKNGFKFQVSGFRLEP